MSATPLEIPFLWPDYRRLAKSPGPTPALDKLLTESRLICGVVHGISETSVRRLKQILVGEPASIEQTSGKTVSPSTGKKVQLIVTLYPTCPTTSRVLLSLFQLQTDHPSLEVRIVTCDIFSWPENTLACYKAP